uniref:Tumor protein p53 inducible protein 3 n=1 Tax=Chelonoidis abingdonii TaxID=106734 RepID=A0A8C0GR19_CHEAB
MLAVYFDQPGGPENLYVKEVPKPHPGRGEVLIKVSAGALNRMDLLQRSGKYPSPKGANDILGLEAAGLVAGFGPGCKGQWKTGDTVMALLSGGGQAEYVTVPEGHLMSIPNGIPFVQAAAIPEDWLTAFQLLHFVGNVQSGQTVLIHAGASGVGTTAIQLTRLAKAIPIVTAGTQEKLKLAAKLGAAAGFNYKEEDFTERVLEFTNGSGVDVILDCIGVIVYGLLGGGEVSWRSACKLHSKRGKKEQVLPYFSQDGSPPVQPIIDSVYPLHRIVEAHRTMEENNNLGKIIIEMPPSS